MWSTHIFTLVEGIPAALSLGISTTCNLTLQELIVQRLLKAYSQFFLHSQDGEIDLKLLTKVLAPEQEIREVCHSSSFLPPQQSHSCNQLAP